MIIAVPKENLPEERRVALVPDSIQKLPKGDIIIQSGAGQLAGYHDKQYIEAGARIEKDLKSLYSIADVILKINPPSSSEIEMFRRGATLISFLNPLSNQAILKGLASHNINAFAMDLIPRISRTQSMDALSSQSNIAGYKAVLLAAEKSQKVFPMMMTAAGTIPPARVFVIGAGVAGLQAIATAKRLGAVVEAYDVRPVVREQVESLGAKFVELKLESNDVETTGGYAKSQSAEFYQRQQKLLEEHAQSSDVIITTALVAGRKAPILLTEQAINKMKPGSVIVDLAAEQGGNCELTEPGNIVVKNDVIIIGLTNLPSTMAREASNMYSRNIVSFVLSITREGAIQFDKDDVLISSSLVVYNGDIVNPSISSAMEKPN
jgi:NAD(P) transhydrogenase subunit alpha